MWTYVQLSMETSFSLRTTVIFHKHHFVIIPNNGNQVQEKTWLTLIIHLDQGIKKIKIFSKLIMAQQSEEII